jgi:hypothetical protein
VYLYPPRRPGTDVEVRSWVRADRADLDVPLWHAVTDWLHDQWPWTAPDYAARRQPTADARQRRHAEQDASWSRLLAARPVDRPGDGAAHAAKPGGARPR